MPYMHDTIRQIIQKLDRSIAGLGGLFQVILACFDFTGRIANRIVVQQVTHFAQ